MKPNVFYAYFGNSLDLIFCSFFLFVSAYSNMKASQQVMERQRLDEMSYRKAAHGPIVKTYSTNPKLKQKSSRSKSKS